MKVQAQPQVHDEITYNDPPQALYRPADAVIEKLATDYEITQAQSRLAQAHYGGSCVGFAKHYLGLTGTWGDGGHLLSFNSEAVVGGVVIFYGVHVAVITALVGNQMTIIESNYDYQGSIRTRILLITDPSIKGFHSFE